MCKTIKQVVKFKAEPREVYRLLADSRQHSAFSGEKASISTREGGRFSVDSGYASGINVLLQPGKRIVQAWRGADFPEGIFSMASFSFSPTPGEGTLLTLVHRGVPKALIPGIEAGWREHYWERMKEYLGAQNSEALMAPQQMRSPLDSRR